LFVRQWATAAQKISDEDPQLAQGARELGLDRVPIVELQGSSQAGDYNSRNKPRVACHAV
jgi:hypothetical protein